MVWICQIFQKKFRHLGVLYFDSHCICCQTTQQMLVQQDKSQIIYLYFIWEHTSWIKPVTNNGRVASSTFTEMNYWKGTVMFLRQNSCDTSLTLSLFKTLQYILVKKILCLTWEKTRKRCYSLISQLTPTHPETHWHV